MAVLAHPDDESMAIGATLAKYAAAGIETYLLTATRGERGWLGPASAYPGPTALGQLREQELAAAARTLGLAEVNVLGYFDGEVDRAAPDAIIGQIVQHLRRIRPHVVVTFDPYGIYGHPDHIAISQFTTAAVVAAASEVYDSPGACHQVSKLYYFTETTEKLEAYQMVFGELVMMIDGQERRASGWQPWATTTEIQTDGYWQQALQAITHHRSQLQMYHPLQDLPEEQHRRLWSSQNFYRAFSLVNSGRVLERDLFEGIARPAA